jgi:hypothetical protein
MNVWADELRAFLRDNERAIAAGEVSLGSTFRHVMGRQAQIPGQAPVAPPGASLSPPAVVPF